ncbi:MAG: glycosyltransferase family 2 protein [Erysipelotrichaceae bacterium]|nr:glycosyltransferase family 2 protein [Erysipelotrichaceae bacterium]
MLSIIVPCYNEAEAVPYFYPELMKHLKKAIGRSRYEILFIDDGSKDDTVKECLKLKEKDANIKIVSFSRNFGKEAAILAGLKESKGDYVVLMDADLQDPPALLKEMYDYVKSGEYDCAGTYRVTRKGEPPIRSFFARAFYKLINKLIDVEIVDGARDYRLMSRKMVDAIISLSEYNRFSKGIFSWVGFRTKYIEYENVERVAGETKWSFWKLFAYAIDGIVDFTIAPLRIATVSGLLVSLFGFLYMLYIVIKALTIGDPVAGYPSMIAIICLLGGIQLIVIGIVGEYLGKTYMETKRRPKYIIREIR